MRQLEVYELNKIAGGAVVPAKVVIAGAFAISPFTGVMVAAGYYINKKC